jgi:hypothetical protein
LATPHNHKKGIATTTTTSSTRETAISQPTQPKKEQQDDEMLAVMTRICIAIEKIAEHPGFTTK